MPDITYAVSLNHQSNLPRDAAVNVLHYSWDAPDSIEGLADEIKGHYATLAPRINGAYENMTIRAYLPAGGPPLLVKQYLQNFNGPEGPQEVALCLSYSADDDAAGTPRRRGRIYLPFWASGGSRPDLAARNAILALGQGLASVGFAGNTTWKMLSRLGDGTPLAPAPVLRKIESISVDDEWDTQRSRGLRATLRTRQDVQ